MFDVRHGGRTPLVCLGRQGRRPLQMDWECSSSWSAGEQGGARIQNSDLTFRIPRVSQWTRDEDPLQAKKGGNRTRNSDFPAKP